MSKIFFSQADFGGPFDGAVHTLPNIHVDLCLAVLFFRIIFLCNKLLLIAVYTGHVKFLKSDVCLIVLYQAILLTHHPLLVIS